MGRIKHSAESVAGGAQGVLVAIGIFTGVEAADELEGMAVVVRV